MNRYNLFKYGSHSVKWYINDSADAIKKQSSIIKKEGNSYPLRKYFGSLFLDSKLLNAVNLTRQILSRETYSATNDFEKLFTSVMV
ncbi:hypothetical protein [Sharpea azabuensis]|uniref:hypothetical protein n=1 Tax=Sharpea azabuensis TaxID=322505 RepID=UPI0015685881|nr:hypothetical protein [Sharpea azabuensis]